MEVNFSFFHTVIFKRWKLECTVAIIKIYSHRKTFVKSTI